VARDVDFGAVRLIPGDTFRDAVREAHVRRPVSAKLQWYADRVDEQVSAWAEDAVLAVEAGDDVAATTLTSQAVALLRLLVRRTAAVNPDIHKIGLADEVVSRLRETVVIHDDGTVGLGWKRLDGGVPFTITAERIDEWLADPVIRYLGDQLVPDAACKELGRKARTAVGVLDRAYVSTEPVEMVLFATIALETLLSADQPDGEYKPQSIPIARRVAYLTCAADHRRTGSGCPYLKEQSTQALCNEILSRAADGKSWLCTAFTKVALPKDLTIQIVSQDRDGNITDVARRPPLFDLRNEAAHQGITSLTVDQARDLRWDVQTILLSSLLWFAEHPDATIHDLDAEMFALDGV
jgi:hypothetical protein